MAFDIINKKEVDFVAVAGDQIVLCYDDENGNEVEVLREEIDETINVKGAVVFKCKNEFGFKKGIGGVFGGD